MKMFGNSKRELNFLYPAGQNAVLDLVRLNRKLPGLKQLSSLRLLFGNEKSL